MFRFTRWIFSQDPAHLPLSCAVAALLFLMLTQTAAVQAQSGTTIVISPTPRFIQQGNVGTISVVINDYNDPNPVGPSGQGLYGADIRLSFDKNIVTVVDDNAGQAGVQVTPGPLLTSGSYLNLINTADNSAGTIQFVITLLASTPVTCPTPPTPCSGVLFTVHLHGNTVGTSPVNFTYQKLSNPNGLQIPATTTNGSIGVYTPTSASVTQFVGNAVKNSQAQLTWETGSEVDLAGFNVWRSVGAESAYAKLNSILIPSKTPGELKGNRYTFEDSGLSANTTYQYKLEAVKTGGGAEWSGPVAVQIPAACSSKPAVTTLVSPTHHASVAQEATLDWTDVACANKYKVQLRHDETRGRQTQNLRAVASTLTTTLEPGQTYAWRVRVLSGKRHSVWSEWRTFTVLRESRTN